MLFGDLVGYTTFSEGRDPELVRESLDLTFQRLAAEATRLGGYVDKVVGDEIMVLFGAPVSHEDDAGRAVEAGLAMQRVLAELGPLLEQRVGNTLQIRIGINTGLVVTGTVGPGAYTVTGDAVNVAARLEKAAEPDQVLVGEATRRLARRQFQWGDRQDLTVKGRAEPVAAFIAQALDASARRLVPAPSSTPYVGRAEVIDALAAAWQRAADGVCSIIQLTGEAGIGKTRLMAHGLDALGVPASQVLYARADTPPRTFGPLLELLPALEGEGRRRFAERIDALIAQDDTQTARFKTGWLVDALVELIGALAEEGPVAVVLDDIHRADRATVDVIKHLLPRLGSLPVLVALLQQPTWRGRLHTAAVQLVIEPLPPGDADGLVRVAAPALGEAERAEIVRRAGGNPLYLEMLAEGATSGGDTLPTSLQAAVVSRLDELPHDERRVLREASVFGEVFYEEPLRLLSAAPEYVFEALQHVLAIGLVDSLPGQVPAYQFRHSLVRQVLYDGLLRSQRTTLHAQAAAALQLSQQNGLEVDAAVIAHHFEAAGESESAARFHLIAAEEAEVLQAPAESRAHRRAANRLLTMASLADMYAATERPSRMARAAGALTHVALALALALPPFLVLATRQPPPSDLTLGLPLDVIRFNLSSFIIAVALGAAPLLLAGVVFNHLAAPLLFRRRTPVWQVAAAALGGWLLGLLALALAFASLVGLLRLNALDRLTSMYVGATMLRFLLGDYRVAITMIAGAAVVSVVWTAVLRLQGRGAWGTQRRLENAVTRPRRAMLQAGVLLTGSSTAALAIIVPYQLKLLPGGSLQPSLSIGVFAALATAALAILACALVVLWLGTRAGAQRGRPRLGLFGFEAPLVCAIAVGIVGWFGMRQAVVTAANDVDSPGQLQAYQRAGRLFPNLVFAQYLLGERYLALEDFPRAGEHLDRAVQLDPSFAASYLPRGRVRIAAGDLAGARADADRLVALKPEHPAGYALRAWVDVLQGDSVALPKDLAAATAPLPPDAQSWDAYFIQCLVLDAAKRTDEARSACLRVLELNPQHYVSLDMLGLMAFHKGDYATAVAYWTQVLAVDDASARVWTNRGLANENLDDSNAAEADLQHALGIDPGAVSALIHLAEVEISLGNNDAARDAADRAVAIDDDYRCNRLYVDRYTNDFARTIEDVTVLLQLAGSGRGCTPVSPGVTAYLLSSRGLAYVQSGEPGKGMADLDLAISTAPEFAPAYDRRGYAYFLQGDYARAAEDFSQVLDRLSTLSGDPSAEFHYHRALLLQVQGNATLASAEIAAAKKEATIPSVKQAIDQAADRIAQMATQ